MLIVLSAHRAIPFVILQSIDSDVFWITSPQLFVI